MYTVGLFGFARRIRDTLQQRSWKANERTHCVQRLVTHSILSVAAYARHDYYVLLHLTILLLIVTNRPMSGFTMVGLPLATPYSTPSQRESRVAKRLNGASVAV